MPESEQSFADRLQRGHTMHAAIASMSPAFAPADTSLLPATYELFLENVGLANANVGDAQADWGTPVVDRQDAAESIQSRTTQALAYVKSNKAWAKNLPAVKKAADAVRAIKPRKPKAPEPPEPGTPPPKPARNKGGESFADIALNFGKFVAALSKVTGYLPPDSAISLSSLGAAKTGLDSLNELVAEMEVALSNAQGDRRDIYNGEEGLRAKMLAIKEAVKGQYGQSSAEYASVKGIKV